MFVWLSSYPKSGNTLIRILLSTYFFSNDGELNFDLLKNIKQFPANDLFKNIGVDINNDEEIAKNYIKAQSSVNKINSIQFVKTHSSFRKMYDVNFTDTQNTLGCIYVVRDPRNVVTSYAHHFQLPIEEACDKMISDNILSRTENTPPTYMGSWGYHYKSWKQLEKNQKYLLIRYEDLIKEKEKFFILILNFMGKISNTNIKIDLKKIKKVLENTDFKRLQELEKKSGFEESVEDKKTGKKINFFNLGSENKWENNLGIDIIKKIENEFQKEMIELGYLKS